MIKAALLSGSAWVAIGALAIGSTPRSQQAGPAPDASPQFGPELEPAEPPAAEAPNPLAAGQFGPGPLHKVRIAEGDETTYARLASSGGLVRTYDYGAFRMAVVDEGAFPSTAALREAGFEFQDEQDLMVFNEIVVNGRQPEAALAGLAPDLRMSLPRAAALDPNAGLYVVQFEGPVRDEWAAALDELGATFAQFLPMNAYVVQLAPERVAALDELAQADFVQFAGLYEPAFRVHATLRAALLASSVEVEPVTIQLIAGPAAREAQAEIASVADEVLGAHAVGPYLNVRARLHPAFLAVLASSPHVFQIEPRGELVRQDERQGQIVAGNVNTTGPLSPGYLAWLAGAGFDSTQFGSFAVNVVDDATSLSGHPDLSSARVAFALNPSSQSGSQGGHGFLNAHIVAGFNSGTGTTLEDSAGYNYGLGIAPWARVGSTAIFGPGFASATSYERQAYGLGARISTNSWSYQTGAGSPIPDYDSASQEYDFLTRDASTATGNQGYTVVFAAGNNGSGSNTISTPSTAKNIVTVAAGENNRQTGTDGCGFGNTWANNWNDLASFSSRGPVNSTGGDGRWKPEISAPGTHVQAGVPQSNYNGASVCNLFFPSGQTLYSWSTGTSHSCPAVAGGAALVHQWRLNQGLPAPSPALTKAVLVASGQYMTGTGAGGTLPSNGQGTGELLLARAVGAASRVVVDQSELLTGTGQSYTVNGNVADTFDVFRVALVWTDAPGPTSGAPYVNNLNLRVTVGGTTYLGNVFSGSQSIAGGTADIRNNTELVFLPAGTSGPFSVTVEGASIGGDGVPGNGDSTDQDFALVVYNGASGAPAAPDANFTGVPTSGAAPLFVSFLDASTGSITSWSWDFGDGFGSSAQNPAHTYSSTGTYTVSLTVTGPGGNDTLTRTNYIAVGSAPPAASFTGTPTAGSAPLQVAFTDTSTGAITGWSWSFGDGGSSTAQHPSHTYQSPGSYTVSLTVSGPGGNDAETLPNYVTVGGGGGASVFYMSFDTAASVPGVGSVADEDVVRYDPASGTWSLYFDGSDVGLASTDIDALHVRANGSILMSFDSATFSVAGLAGGPAGTTVEDSDVILFTPTSTGSTTAGSFSFYFDGSDVGLTTANEDVDGLFESSDGSLGISLLGGFSVTGASGQDEDVVRFTGTFGSATSGAWSWVFDGSDVGFNTSSSEDLDAIDLPEGTDLVFSTQGAYSAAGASGAGADVSVFTGTFGSATSGSAALVLDLSALGIDASENVDAMGVAP